MTHLADSVLSWSPLNANFRVIDAQRGLFSLAPWRRKVLIYGAGHGRAQAHGLLSDPEWEVWCLNLVPAYDGRRCVRADVWFDLHQRVAQTADDLRWIAACPRPIFVPDDLMGTGPTCMRFPIEMVEDTLKASYWACTFAYQIALAICAGYTDVGLYGVELSAGTRRERTVEWACVSWWLGFAEARGLTIHLPAGSRLGAHPHRYGLEYAAEIDEVDAYLRDFEDSDRREFSALDLRRRGVRAETPRSVGG